MSIELNINNIKNEIALICKDCGRNPGEVNLMAVTKTVDTDAVLEAIDAGITDVGENKPQELARKYDVIGDKVNWHLIGTLQTNKVKYIIDKVTMIHSLDREALC
ncbi:MAG: YggS family pyridoxal phosphate-dependent enzyme, partial [Intestinibacter sp.]